MRVALDLAPQRAEPGAHVGVGQQLVLQLLALGQQLRIGAQPVGERGDARVDRPRAPRGPGRRRRRRGSCARRRRSWRRSGRRSARAPTTATRARGGRGTWRGSRRGSRRAREHRVEQPLVVPALDSQVDRPADQRRDRRRPDPALDQRLQRRAHVAIVEHLERAAQQRRRRRRRPCAALPASASQSPRRLPTLAAGQSLVEHLAGEEVGLHELAERRADLVLAVRDDRRVRDGDAEWVAEQRRSRRTSRPARRPSRLRRRRAHNRPSRGAPPASGR